MMSTPASPEPSGAPPFAYDGGEPFTPTSFASPQPEDFDIDAMDAQEQAYQREQQEIQAAIAAAAEQQQEISKKQVIASHLRAWRETAAQDKAMRLSVVRVLRPAAPAKRAAGAASAWASRSSAPSGTGAPRAPAARRGRGPAEGAAPQVGLGSLTHSARKLAADRAARERADALARAAESAGVRDLATHDRVAAERARLGAVLDVVAAAGEAAAARGAAAAAAAEAAAAAARGAVGAVDAAEARDAAEAADERRRDSERDAAARRLRCDEAEASAERADEARADAERARDDAADEAFWSDDATKAADASIKAATFLRHRGNLRRAVPEATSGTQKLQTSLSRRRAAVAACARAYHATALAAALARRALLHWRCQADARRAKAIVAARLLGRCRLRSRAAHRAFARWRTWTEFAAKRQVFPA
ncbi:hypothetical protein JL722_2526 [Aureococcus anophagefferens]|nr:hypothetical protein JL722_2526 [Aureococcus anophagefferens]